MGSVDACVSYLSLWAENVSIPSNYMTEGRERKVLGRKKQPWTGSAVVHRYGVWSSLSKLVEGWLTLGSEARQSILQLNQVYGSCHLPQCRTSRSSPHLQHIARLELVADAIWGRHRVPMARRRACTLTPFSRGRWEMGAVTVSPGTGRRPQLDRGLHTGSERRGHEFVAFRGLRLSRLLKWSLRSKKSHD